MAKPEVDLLVALGEPGKKNKKEAGPSYLSGKPVELRAYLEDAVDSSLSKEQRAEALCRALEFTPGEEEEEVEEVESPLTDEFEGEDY